MKRSLTSWLALTGFLFGAGAIVPCHAASVKTIILVHGAFADGSGWKGVYERLVARGFKVQVLQEPEISVTEDVAAARRLIDAQDGPVVLVGHSYGGLVITEAGVDPKVAALVYVAAIAADVGETVKSLNEKIPPVVKPAVLPLAGGFLMINPAEFRDRFAADLSKTEANFMAHSQVTISATLFETPASVAAWRSKPTFGVVAGADRTLNPKLERFMYERANAEVREIAGASHSVYISHPDQVTDVIAEAAKH